MIDDYHPFSMLPCTRKTQALAGEVCVKGRCIRKKDVKVKT